MRTSAFLSFMLILPACLFAQSIDLELPRVSPEASVSQRIALTDITVNYQNAEKYLRKCLAMNPSEFLADHAKGLLNAMGVEDLPN